METYSIIRMYRETNRVSEIVETGLTLEQAQTHCRSEDTHGEGWFDGYETDRHRKNERGE